MFARVSESLLLDVNVMATLLQQVLKSQEHMQQMIAGKQETVLKHIIVMFNISHQLHLLVAEVERESKF